MQQFIRFLYRLASLNKDYAVVMCRVGTKEALVKALDKHSTNLLLVTELRDVISDCEKYASLYKKMTTSVLAGCIQVHPQKCVSLIRWRERYIYHIASNILPPPPPFPVRWCWVRLKNTVAAISRSTSPFLMCFSGTSAKVGLGFC